MPSSSSHGKRNGNFATIVGVVIGGVAAVFAVIGVTIFVRHRRRRARPKSVFSDFRDAGPELIVTPFDPHISGAAQDSRILAEQPLVARGPEAEMVHRPSVTPPTPLPRPETPVPVGLSDKEIARLRAEGFNTRQSPNLDAPIPLSQSEAPVPVGLSDKEIARLRALNSRQSPNLGVSSSNEFQSTSPLDAPIPLSQPDTTAPVGLSEEEIAQLRSLNSQRPGALNLGVLPSASSSDVLLQSTSSPTAVSGPLEAPIDPRRLQSEVESRVREEMDRLRAQGLVLEAPPSYSTEGAV